jgi:phage tail-like protein
VTASDAFARSTFTGKFLVEVDGLTIGTFTEVDGLEVEVGVETFEEGGQNQYVHKLPGRMSWPNLVLKRGVTKADNLFEWLAESAGDGMAAKGNKVVRKSAAVTLLSDKGERLRAWEVAAAFPIKWHGPRFAASSTELATEELEIAHHGFRPTTP